MTKKLLYMWWPARRSGLDSGFEMIKINWIVPSPTTHRQKRNILQKCNVIILFTSLTHPDLPELRNHHIWNRIACQTIFTYEDLNLIGTTDMYVTAVRQKRTIKVKFHSDNSLILFYTINSSTVGKVFIFSVVIKLLVNLQYCRTIKTAFENKTVDAWNF